MTITTKNKCIIVLSTLTLFTASCSSDMDNIDKEDNQPSTETTMDSAHVNRAMSDKLESYGQEHADEWFIENLIQSGVDVNRDTILNERETICKNIRRGKTLEEISELIPRYTDEQKGIIIASSMISECPESVISF